MEFTGTWHIYEMSNWDDEYFNMEVQAYIEIDEQGNGEFQFGLVHGYIDGDIIKDGLGRRLSFPQVRGGICGVLHARNIFRIPDVCELNDIYPAVQKNLLDKALSRN
jgi:hypothetical protein